MVLFLKRFLNYVYRLRKTLHGLKQTPCVWYGKITQYFEFCGFRSSSADSSLFVDKTNSLRTMFLLYVDDLIITNNDDVKIICLQDALCIHFKMKSLGEARCFLGLEI